MARKTIFCIFCIALRTGGDEGHGRLRRGGDDVRDARGGIGLLQAEVPLAAGRRRRGAQVEEGQVSAQPESQGGELETPPPVPCFPLSAAFSSSRLRA